MAESRLTKMTEPWTEVVVKGPGVDNGARRPTQREMDHFLLVAATLMSGSGAVNWDTTFHILFKRARLLWEQRCRESWRFDEEVV